MIKKLTRIFMVFAMVVSYFSPFMQMTVYAESTDYAATLKDLDLGTAVEGYDYQDFDKSMQITKTGTAALNGGTNYMKLALTDGNIEAFNCQQPNTGNMLSNSSYNIGGISPKAGLSAGTYTATVTLYYDIDGTGTGYDWQVLDTATVTFVVNAAGTKYAVTITDGTANKTEASAGEIVTITANAPADGKTFSKWTVTSGEVTLANVNNSSTSFTMPASDVSISANYVEATFTATLQNLDLGTTVVGYDYQNFDKSMQITKTGTATMNGNYMKIELTSGDIDKFNCNKKSLGNLVGTNTWDVANVSPKTGLSAGTYEATITLSYDTSGSGSRWDVLDTATVKFVVNAAGTYTVTFDTNGGTTVADQTITSGNTATKPADPTKTGYTFAGWYGDAEFTSEFDFDTAITGNVTIYAKWTEDITELTELLATITLPTDGANPVLSGTSGDDTKYSIKNLHFYDGSTLLSTTDVFEVGKTYKIEVIFMAKTGYKIANSASVKINGIDAESNGIYGDGSVNYKIEYTVPVPTYTVSFNANGGTGSMSSITQTENSKYTLPSNGFTAPSGKLFKCWSVNGVEKNVGSVITITSDITIKAVWKDSIVAISKTSISITNQYYTGKAINYNPVIKYNGKTLKLNIDYTLSYTNNIKLGTATVVIKGIGNYNGSVTKTFKIVIAPVSGLVTTAQTTSSISLKWNKNNLVDGYEVYYATSKNGKYKKATTITKNGTVTYKKSSLKAGTTYYFKIRSYKKISGVKKYSDYSSVIIGNTIPAKVTIKTPTVAGSTVTVKWSKQATATGYEVYSSTTKNGTYKLEKNITGASNVSLSISNLIPGKTYYYKVRSYRVVEGKKYYGAYSKVTSKKVSLPGKVTQLTPTVKNGIVTIKWKKVSNVSGYEIQMSTDKKNYTLLETVKNPSQVKSITEGFEKGKTYYLKIRAYILVNGTKYYGSYSAVKSVKIK